MEKLEVHTVDKMNKKLLSEAMEFQKLGNYDMAQNLIKLAAHNEMLRTKPRDMIVPKGCTVI